MNKKIYIYTERGWRGEREGKSSRGLSHGVFRCGCRRGWSKDRVWMGWGSERTLLFRTLVSRCPIHRVSSDMVAGPRSIFARWDGECPSLDEAPHFPGRLGRSRSSQPYLPVQSCFAVSLILRGLRLRPRYCYVSTYYRMWPRATDSPTIRPRLFPILSPRHQNRRECETVTWNSFSKCLVSFIFLYVTRFSRRSSKLVKEHSGNSAFFFLDPVYTIHIYI